MFLASFFIISFFNESSKIEEKQVVENTKIVIANNEGNYSSNRLERATLNSTAARFIINRGSSVTMLRITLSSMKLSELFVSIFRASSWVDFVSCFLLT